MFLFELNVFYSVLAYFLIFIGILVLILLMLRKGICWYLNLNEIKTNQAKILEKLSCLDLKLDEKQSKYKLELMGFGKSSSTTHESEISEKKELTEDESIQEIFKQSKTIVVYNLDENDKNIYTYFKAKQYKVMLIDRNVEDFKNYATIMSVDDKIDILILKVDSDKLKDILKECIARRKIKNDIKYIWIDNRIDDEKFLEEFYKHNIRVIFGKDIYKEYVRLMLRKN